MVGEGFEIEAVNARDEAALYLKCVRCGAWEEHLGTYQAFAVDLNEINRQADAHEHTCPGVV